MMMLLEAEMFAAKLAKSGRPELVQALPGRLKKALAELNPSGPINLRGGIGVLATVAGVKVEDLLPKDKLDAMVTRTRNGGIEIRTLDEFLSCAVKVEEDAAAATIEAITETVAVDGVLRTNNTLSSGALSISLRPLP